MRARPLPAEIEEDRALFWDAQPGTIDPEIHAPYVIARILGLGNLAQVRALENYYGRDRLRAFFLDGGLRQVDAQTASFWLLILKIDRHECERRSSLPPSATSWSG
jgi:uncharacterized protein DUF6922